MESVGRVLVLPSHRGRHAGIRPTSLVYVQKYGDVWSKKGSEDTATQIATPQCNFL